MATDDFLGTICIGDNNNYYNLEFGFSNGNSNKYNSNTDRYAPPPPPQNFFDAALNYKGERYYSKIINPINETFYIMLQYGENNTINIKWDNSDWNKILDACVLEDIAKGGLGVKVDMLEENEITITNNDVTKLKLIYKILEN